MAEERLFPNGIVSQGRERVIIDKRLAVKRGVYVTVVNQNAGRQWKLPQKRRNISGRQYR